MLVQAEAGQRGYAADRDLKRAVGAVGELPRALELVEQRRLAEQVTRDRERAGSLHHRDDLPVLTWQLRAAVGVVVTGEHGPGQDAHR